MSDLLIGTDRGVFRLDTDGTARPEEGPASGDRWRRLAGDLPTMNAVSVE